MIFWMDMCIHFTSNAEMSRPKQFHVSRPKCNVFLIMMLMPVFFKPSLHMLLDSASSRIRFLPVQAKPTARRSSRRAVAHGRHIGRYFYFNIAITNNSTFPKIKLHYSISYCNKTKSNNLI